MGIFPASAAVSGEGRIGRIVFKAIDIGTATTNISLDNSTNSDLGFFDKNAALIPAFGLGSNIAIQ